MFNYQKTFRRYRFHFRRYQTILLYSATIWFLFTVLVIGIFTPDEEGLRSYLSALDDTAFNAIIKDIPSENPSVFLWYILMSSFFLIGLGIVGIFLGTEFLPMPEEAGKEILLSTPLLPSRHFLENILVSFLALVTITLPAFIITYLFALINNSGEILPNLIIGYAHGILLASIFMLITSFGTTLNFSRITGVFLGSFIFLLNFFIMLFVETETGAEISLITQAHIFDSAFHEKIELDFIVLALLINACLILLSLAFLSKTDHIARKMLRNETLPIDLEEEQDAGSKSPFRNPILLLIKRLRWRFPSVQDQFYMSSNMFIVYLAITCMFSILVVFNYPGEEKLQAAMTGLQNPLFDAFLFEHELGGKMQDFLAIKFFSMAWAFYGIFIVLIVDDVVLRDFKKYGDTTWQFPRSQGEIMMSRVIAAVSYYAALFVLNLLVTIIAIGIKGSDADIGLLVAGYLVFIWGYCVFVLFFTALALIPPLKHARKTLIFSFVGSIMIVVIGFLAEIAWMRYLSPFGYYDMIGIIGGKVAFVDELPKFVGFTLLSGLLLFVVLKTRLQTKDLVS
ncbi:MAG: hypothetical protein ACFFGZ_00935 [Candidatus Thorarchaeota archaeon]